MYITHETVEPLRYGTALSREQMERISMPAFDARKSRWVQTRLDAIHIDRNVAGDRAASE